MLDFRLDPGRREAITKRTLAEHRGGVPRTLSEATAATLEAGSAILAVLHVGGTPTALDDAVARAHGRLIANNQVDAQALRTPARSCSRPSAPPLPATPLTSQTERPE